MKNFWKTVSVLLCMALLFALPAFFAGAQEDAIRYQLGNLTMAQDRQINSQDARIALRAAARLEKLTPEQVLAGDVNGDGTVNSRDARKILRVAAKLDIFDEITIEINAGESYAFDRLYQPGNRYIWYCDAEPNQNIHVDMTYIQPKSPAAPGNTNKQIFYLTAKEPGTYPVRFRLAAASPGNEPPIEENIYTFVVR